MARHDKKRPLKDERDTLRTGFVLAGAAVLPNPETIIEAAHDLGLHDLVSERTDKDGILSFGHSLGDFMVTLVGIRHPDAARMPIGPFSPTSEEIEKTSAHFITVLTSGKGSLKERDLAIARFTAAVALANRSLAAMLGHGVAFHRTATFVDAVVEAGDDGVPVPGGVDITLAGEADERVSFLTHGMERYGREELYVIAEQTDEKMEDAYYFTVTIASWMLSDDTQLLDGETVGRSDEERIAIKRVKSPAGSKRQVIKLELK